MSENKSAPALKNKRRIILLNSLIIIVLLFAIYQGVSAFGFLNRDLYTNDAQVEAYINPVNVRIPGYIKEVRFQEHQRVNKGDTLVLIDESEYRIQLAQAEAAYLSAQALRKVSRSSVHTVRSSLGVSDANIRASTARLWNAGENLRRFKALLGEGAATQQQYDQVKSDYDALMEQRNSLKQQRLTVNLSTEEASSKLTVNDAEIKRTAAAVALARLNLSYTVVRAPYSGVTGRRNIQEGQLVQAGQNLLTFVREDQKWVVANYKEDQISRIHPGQIMDLVIDGYEELKLQGRVEAISQATGARYAAIPVDNSTGNFIKVKQRIPVKITILNQNHPEVIKMIRAGMNVEVRVAR